MRFVRSRSVFSPATVSTISLLAVLGVACGVDTEGVGVVAGGGNTSEGGRAGSGARAGSSSDGGGPGKAGAGGGAGKGGAAGTGGGGVAGKGGGASGKGGASGSGGITGGNAGTAGGAGKAGQGGKGGGGGSGGSAGTSAGGSGGSAGGPGPAGSGGNTSAGTGGSGGNAGSTSAGSGGDAGSAGNTNAGNGGASGAGAAGASGSGASGASGSGGAPPAPKCGDGRVNQAAEECDDGNTIDTDACTNACLVRCPGQGAVVTEPGAKNPATDRCYFTTAASRPDAPTLGTATCVGPGEHLAILHDARDLTWLGGLLPQTGYRAWVGGRRNPNIPYGPNAFAWYEGGPVAASAWGPGEPDDPDACVTLRVVDVDGGAGVVSRFRLSTSSCQRSDGVGFRTLCVREPTCRIGTLDGVVGDGGHCYLASPTDLPSFEAARNFCSDLGGHLATFETPDELRRLGGVDFRNVWVGATQTVSPGGATNAGWRWTEGPNPTLAVSDEVWLGGEPNDGGGKASDSNAEDCASLLNGTRRLNDAPCTQTINRALCEFE